MKDTVLDEISVLLEQQPLLTKCEVTDGIKISGKYKICIQIEDELFEDYFALEITVSNGFPDDIPTVISTDRKIRANNYKEHVYSNGQFCLEIDTEIATFLHANPSLRGFLTRFLDTYLCGFMYYQKHKRLPFGEHKHGIWGLMDYYCELFETADINIAYSLLACVLRENLQGHIRCPCQSGKRYRDCHREKINELKASSLYQRYKDDFMTIITEQNKRNTR